MSVWSRSIDARVYRWTVRLSPPRFRDDYAEQMVCDFEDGKADAAAGGPSRLWLFRGRMATDLVTTLVVQWLRSGVPAIAVLSSIVPLLLLPALAALWRHSQFVIPVERADSEVVGLAVLATCSVLLIATTIVLTLRTLHPLLRRHQRR